MWPDPPQCLGVGGKASRIQASSSCAQITQPTDLDCLGAIACLFAGLMLVARLLRLLGITEPEWADEQSEQPRPPGGKRAAR